MSKVTELFAYVAMSPEGKEGVAMIKISEEVWIPLVTESKEQAEAYRPVAQKIAEAFGKPVFLARFSVREDLETLS